MPCYLEVKIEVALELKDRRMLALAVKAVGARLQGNRIEKGNFGFELDERGRISAKVLPAEEQAAKKVLGELKRQYTFEVLKNWSSQHRLTARERGGKLVVRRWV